MHISNKCSIAVHCLIFINEYGKANPDQRVRMIFLNYTSFQDIIEGYVDQEVKQD